MREIEDTLLVSGFSSYCLYNGSEALICGDPDKVSIAPSLLLPLQHFVASCVTVACSCFNSSIAPTASTTFSGGKDSTACLVSIAQSLLLPLQHRCPRPSPNRHRCFNSSI